MKKTIYTKQQCLDDIVRVQNELHGESEKIITRNQYRKYSIIPERTWKRFFGTFQELRRQAGITPRREIEQIERQVAKHASKDHLRIINKERQEWDENYLIKNKSRYQTMLIGADFHDINVDPFFLRVWLETAHRIQPNIVCFAGDVYDLPEFGKFHVDPRDFDIKGRMNFVHNKIFGPIRERCKDAQIDLIEANHELRLWKHLCSNSPEIKIFLSDWLGLKTKDLFRLDDFKINYIAKADLTAWNQTDEKKELRKNFKIYHDCLLVYHYPDGKNRGLPGINGHHHKHEMWSFYSHIFGPYEWHQIGCGHRRDASYTEGLKWANGFMIAHIDTKDRLVNFEYIPVTNQAIVGGKFYYRKQNEIVTPGYK